MARIALIADLHGNLPAVRALEDDMKHRALDGCWCLGDLIGKGPSTAECCDWAREHCDMILQGNWDSGVSQRKYPGDQYHWERLGEERMSFLRSLPQEKRLWVSGKRIRMLHGRPVMEPLRFIQAEDEYFAAFMGELDVLVYADTHRPGTRLPGTGLQVVNTGSVGNGMGLNMVQYCVMEGEIDSRLPAPLSFSFITVPYDREAAVRDALEAENMPYRELYIEEIRTGRYCR